MPLILQKFNRGRRDVLIILGPENIERMREKDPFEMKIWEMPGDAPMGVIQIVFAYDAEMMQIEQLARQGKTEEAIKMATSGWRYRPEKGDHDLGPEKLGSI